MAHQPDDGSSDFMESYEPAPPVWYLLKEHIPASELPEIRGIFGDALIDVCTDTYSEVKMWVQVWKGVCRNHGSTAKPPRAGLADSPVVKELLTAEIRLLLLSLREKAAREGRDEESIMSSYSPSVVSYVMGGSGQLDRSQSAGSRLDRQEAPSRPQSAKSLQEVSGPLTSLDDSPEERAVARSSSRLSSSSDCEDGIGAFKHELNLKGIHKVVAHLKSVLNEDLDAMKREIQFLQDCVEQKHQSHSDSLTPEPTVSELKEERKLIQKDLQPEEAACGPWLAGRMSADRGRGEGHRVAGQLSASSTWSRPAIFPKDRPPLEPSLPPAATTRPPACVLHSSRHARESSHRHGDQPEERAPRPANSASPAASLPARRPRPLPDPDRRPDLDPLDPRDVREGAGLSRYGPSGGHFPSSVLRPRPPAQRRTHGDDAAAVSLVPAPPAMQKPATRGQPVARRLRLPQGGLVSPT